MVVPMASPRVIRVEGYGSIAVSLIAAGLAGLGVPRVVWVFVLAAGICLGIYTVLQLVMAKRKKNGGRTTPSKKSLGQVNAKKIEQGDSSTIIGQQNNYPPQTPAPPAPPGSGVVIRDCEDVTIDDLYYEGRGNAVDAANSTNVTARNIRHFSTKREGRAKEEEKGPDEIVK